MRIPGTASDGSRRVSRVASPLATALIYTTAFLAFAQSPHSVRAESGLKRWNLFAPVSEERVDTKPHPAVVRVIADEGRMTANGSGSFIAVRDQHGLVVTNWHVVRDAKGPIQVIFPDGFRSEARVLKTDSDWDLAALLIWRPNVQPIVISQSAPQPGDALTIAGYGQGDYRSVSGKCTQYLSPSIKHPYEMVELSARARQGDSGGPILNDRGELAGVLFGADRATTSGSYCGRVRWFLSSVWPDIDVTQAPQPAIPFVGFQPERQAPAAAAQTDQLVPVRPFENTPPLDQVAQPELDDANHAAFRSSGISLPPLPASTPKSEWSWNELAGSTRWDHAKSLLAVIGILAIWRKLSSWMTN